MTTDLTWKELLCRERGATQGTLAGRIRACVERRARGQIRDLDVECSGGLVVLTGRSRTHHAKQLALQAVLELAGGRPELANRIVVG